MSLFFCTGGIILPAACSQMTPEVIAGALPDSSAAVSIAANTRPRTPMPGETKWYIFLPEETTGACLKTAQDLCWQFPPSIDIGEWKAYAPSGKHLIMEAKGSEFILYKGYVWDGATIGTTTLSLLAPTLVHDALYHALMHKAPVSRSVVDNIFRRLMIQYGFTKPSAYYFGARCAGTAFNKPDIPPTLVLEITRPAGKSS